MNRDTRRVYLDANATCPILPEVKAAMAAALAVPGNASSIHREGRQARALIEQARRTILQAIDAGGANLYFTSGATEANNWALTVPGPVLVSAIEHPSVLDARIDAITMPVTRQGVADLAALEVLIEQHEPRLVAVMLANNETGIVQPIQEIAAICQRAGTALHVDAVQALGKIPLSFRELNCQSLSLSAHKCGGPAGIGALVLAPGYQLESLLRGGGQEQRQRAGTENLAGIAGFAAAIQHRLPPSIEGLRDQFEAALLTTLDDVWVVGQDQPRLPNTSCIGISGIAAETALMDLDLAGIAISSGSACSSGKVAHSHVLAAMGMAPPRLGEALRVSASWQTTEADYRRLLAGLTSLQKRVTEARNADPDLVLTGENTT